MHCTRKITEDITWIGASDRRLNLFENLFPVPRGASYNSYVILDEKTVLMDTVDSSVGAQFFENLMFVLRDRALDYLVVQHMEPDHCAQIEEVMRRFPDAKLICTEKAKGMIGQFYNDGFFDRILTVTEGDKLSIGARTLHFVMAPMVHWPEVMMTYDDLDKVLFTADAFGTFGALSGNIFDDEITFDSAWVKDMRRYYSNIVGKYGAQVQAVLKKAATLDIEVICPLHGPVYREKLEWILDKYQAWSTYAPEEDAVAIFYASMYGGTENAVDILASALAEKGIHNIAMYDLSTVDVSEMVAECFRCSHIVLASPTYNGEMHPRMHELLTEMKAVSVQNRTIGLIENGSWAPVSARKMTQALGEMKNISILEPVVTVRAAVKQPEWEVLMQLAEALEQSIKK